MTCHCKVSIIHFGKVRDTSISWITGAGVYILTQLQTHDLTGIVSDYLNASLEYNLNTHGADDHEEIQFIAIITLKYVINSPHIVSLKVPFLFQ